LCRQFPPFTNNERILLPDISGDCSPLSWWCPSSDCQHAVCQSLSPSPINRHHLLLWSLLIICRPLCHLEIRLRRRSVLHSLMFFFDLLLHPHGSLHPILS